MVYWIGRTLELVRIGFINLDDAGKSLDAEFGERHGLLLTEYFGGAGDGMKVVELVDGGRGQAPRRRLADRHCQSRRTATTPGARSS